MCSVIVGRLGKEYTHLGVHYPHHLRPCGSNERTQVAELELPWHSFTLLSVWAATLGCYYRKERHIMPRNGQVHQEDNWREL